MVTLAATKNAQTAAASGHCAAEISRAAIAAIRKARPTPTAPIPSSVLASRTRLAPPLAGVTPKSGVKGGSATRIVRLALVCEGMVMPSTLARTARAGLSAGRVRVAGKRRGVAVGPSGLMAMLLMQAISSDRPPFMGRARPKMAVRSGGQGPVGLSAPIGRLFGTLIVAIGLARALVKRPATKRLGLRHQIRSLRAGASLTGRVSLSSPVSGPSLIVLASSQPTTATALQRPIADAVGRARTYSNSAGRMAGSPAIGSAYRMVPDSANRLAMAGTGPVRSLLKMAALFFSFFSTPVGAAAVFFICRI